MKLLLHLLTSLHGTEPTCRRAPSTSQIVGDRYRVIESEIDDLKSNIQVCDNYRRRWGAKRNKKEIGPFVGNEVTRVAIGGPGS